VEAKILNVKSSHKTHRARRSYQPNDLTSPSC